MRLKMNIETSSAVRKYLPKILKAVFENNEDLEIELYGQVVAILTLQEPHRAIAPLRIKTEDAKKGWSELLQAVSTRKARFAFYRKSGEHKYQIYLVPNPKCKNSFSEGWANHVASWKENAQTVQSTGSVRLEPASDIHLEFASIHESLKGLKNIVKHTFALINRGGDVFKTPELGTLRLVDADDLERYEAD
jgi:predicted MPP superfamily phosphohydrolase